MGNYKIRLDLLKLEGAIMRNLKGKTATKRCVIIPVDDNDSIYLGQKGCYLNLTAIEMGHPQFDETHCIKGDIPKDKRDTMTEEQRRAQPILGGLRPMAQSQQPTMQVDNTIGEDAFTKDDGELPF